MRKNFILFFSNEPSVLNTKKLCFYIYAIKLHSDITRMTIIYCFDMASFSHLA